MLLFLLFFIDFDRFEARKHNDRSSHIYWKFADFTGILKGFGKGSLCSMSIWGVRKEYGTYWKCTSSSENVRKEYWNSERILETIGKHSSCSRSIRCVRKAYRSQCLLIFIPNAPRTRRMLPERFPYMPDAHRMLPEHFPNTHIRHIRKVDENYFEHAQNNFWATECRAEQPVCS